LGVVEAFETPLTSNLISARIHKQASLEVDSQIKSAFAQLNRKRELDGKISHQLNPRYRIIYRPHFQNRAGKREYVLDLGEIDFGYLALLVEKDVSLSTKEYLREKIRAVGEQLPKSLQSTDEYFNALSEGLLGVQMVLITSDGYTLLRRRRKHVLEYPEAWDVSFSGYCGVNAVNKDKATELDIWYTVKYELEKEIGLLRADLRDIVFTGLHYSKTSGTTVVLGYWKIKSTRAELASTLNEKYPTGPTVFTTTEKAEEIYLWHSDNMIVEFDGPSIARALKRAERPQPIVVPAARASFILALTAERKPTVGLES
jgi:hypothetical protein